MTDQPLSVVTGAFGFSGKYITRRLLARGERVLTLTGSPDRPHEFGSAVRVAPFLFDDEEAMAESMRGASTLYNTYWVRFAKGDRTHKRAVANTQALIRAAEGAGIRRIVHVSITNPSLDSSLPYFRGKAVIEESIRHSRLAFSILRPTVLFGAEDILINNIAHLLRRLPLFAIPGSGEYRLQPIYVEDLADLAVAAGRRETSDVIDAVGPETFTFTELVHTIAQAIGNSARIIQVPPLIALACSRAIGLVLRDVVLTHDELRGLMAGLLVSPHPPTGTTRLSSWLRENAATVGSHYASELGRHYQPLTL
ncbi:MAG: NAD(P)H-binding protein [bacterium]|nr:NAD(P)H-binding protein [bacterium]